MEEIHIYVRPGFEPLALRRFEHRLAGFDDLLIGPDGAERKLWFRGWTYRAMVTEGPGIETAAARLARHVPKPDRPAVRACLVRIELHWQDADDRDDPVDVEGARRTRGGLRMDNARILARSAAEAVSGWAMDPRTGTALETPGA